MEELRHLYRCKDEIEWQLKLIGCAVSSQPKRFRPEANPRPKNQKFESTLLRLKTKWNQSINAIFHSIQDTGVYDKLAHDLTRTFHTLYTKYIFDDDQLNFAFRCTLIPVSAQILQEEGGGRKANERQERRKYFLLKLLSFGIEEKDVNPPRQETPSLDGSVDVCSDNPRPCGSQFGSTHRDVSLDSGRHPVRYLRPTTITITVIDVLIDALVRFTRFIANNNITGRERIYHVTNITHVVDILKRFLEDVRQQIENYNQYELMQDLNFDLLVKSFEEYKCKLWNALDQIDVTTPHTVFRFQMDMILMQITYLRAMIKTDRHR